jgi:serine protease Do
MSFSEKLRTEKLLSFTLVVLTLCVGILIGTLISVDWGVRAAKGNQAAPGATPLTIPNPVELSTAFSQIAKQVEPSVVHITTKYLPKAPTQTRNRRRLTPAPGDEGNGGMEEFFQFFGNPFGNGVPEMPDSQGGEALGSGVVVDRAGYILTNNHVVDKADSIKVKFTGDPLSYDAKVVGVDEQTDLAVIRVQGKTDLTPAKIGNSDAVQVGDWAVAIGSPFDFQNTVTAGIISATARDIPDNPSQYQHFLQTDAAINPGNSGGPLLNIRGLHHAGIPGHRFRPAHQHRGGGLQPDHQEWQGDARFHRYYVQPRAQPDEGQPPGRRCFLRCFCQRGGARRSG